MKTCQICWQQGSTAEHARCKMSSRYIYKKTQHREVTQTTQLRAKQRQLPKAGCGGISCLVPTGQISNMWCKHTVGAQGWFCVLCVPLQLTWLFSLLMGASWIPMVHSNECKYNVGVAYFQSRSRELWGGVWFINHTLPWSYKWHETAAQRNPTSTLTHAADCLHAFSSLFECIWRLLVWSLTWWNKFDFNSSNTHTYTNSRPKYL